MRHKIAELMAGALGLLLAQTAQAQTVRIMVMNDQSGTYSADSGIGSVRAAELAVKDFGGTVASMPIEVVGVDHQNKVDIASAAARKGFDVDQVDAVFDIANSAASLAVQDIAREKGKVVVHVGTATADLYGKACSPTGALWLYDTYSLSQGLVKAIYANGGSSWYFLSADYSFGKTMQAEAERTLNTIGGKPFGSIFHPLGANDFSSFLVQAQSSNPKVIALINAGSDTSNALKQAHEFGMDGNGITFAIFTGYLNTMKAMGPEVAKGVQYLSGFYWDRDEGSRAFAKRFAAVHNGAMPSETQAGVYSAVHHYLRAVAATKSRDGLVVMRQMKAMPLDDFFAPGATVRPDGRLTNDQYLLEGKGSDEMRGPWDIMKVVRTVKSADIIRPLGEGGCTQLDGPQ
jgi:branched-chain amino acid transport system substrate-binding protein